MTPCSARATAALEIETFVVSVFVSSKFRQCESFIPGSTDTSDAMVLIVFDMQTPSCVVFPLFDFPDCSVFATNSCLLLKAGGIGNWIFHLITGSDSEEKQSIAINVNMQRSGCSHPVVTIN
jgi:hypothetical protein